jgi:hypothetical protein
VERNGLPRRSARHHVLLLISFLFSFSSRCSYHLVLDKTITSSCDTRRIRIRVPIMTLPALTAPLLYLFFTFPYFTSLFSHSRTMLTDAKLLPRGIRTVSFTLFYLSLYALVRSIQSPSPAPPRSPLRYRSYRYRACTVYKTAVLLVGASTLISSN